MSRYEDVPICDKCWEIREGERVPVRLKGSVKETCFGCGATTESGIYVRHNVHNPWLGTPRRVVKRAHASPTHSSAFLRERRPPIT